MKKKKKKKKRRKETHKNVKLTSKADPHLGCRIDTLAFADESSQCLLSTREYCDFFFFFLFFVVVFFFFLITWHMINLY